MGYAIRIEVVWRKSSQSLCVDRDKFSDDAGPSGDMHLAHDQPEKGLNCVRADPHLRGDLFARHSLDQKAQRFLLARSQVEERRGSRDIDDSPIVTIQYQSMRRIRGRKIRRFVETEKSNPVLSVSRVKYRLRRSLLRRTQGDQNRAQLCLQRGREMRVLHLLWVDQCPDRFCIVADRSE